MMAKVIRNVRRIYPIIKNNGLIYTISLIMVSARNFIINLLTAFLFSSIVSNAIGGDIDRLMDSVVFFFLVLLVFVLIDGLGLYIHSITTHKMLNDLRENLYSKIIKARLDELNKIGRNKGEVLSMLNNDLEIVSSIFSYELIVPMMFLISGVGAFIAIFTILPLISIYLSMIGLISLILHMKYGEKERVLTDEFLATNVNIMDNFNILGNYNLAIRMGDLVDFLQDRFNKNLNGYDANRKRYSALQSHVHGTNIITFIFQYVGTSLICLYFVYLNQLKLEQVLFIVQLSGGIVIMFNSFGNTNLILQKFLSGFKRVNLFLDLEEEDIKSKTTDFIPNDHRDIIKTKDLVIRLQEEVQLSYKDIIIEKNKINVIKGVSGSGKTSLYRLLLGFNTSYSGSVKLYGKELREYGIGDLRENISYLPQNDFIIYGTIMDNILLGNEEEINLEDIHRITKLTCAYDWIMDLEDQFDTLISEGGKNISGGQRQTIAFARTLLRRSKMILLDEPFSAMDKQRTIQIMENISNVEDRTFIIISHDDFPVKSGDNLIWI